MATERDLLFLGEEASDHQFVRKLLLPVQAMVLGQTVTPSVPGPKTKDTAKAAGCSVWEPVLATPRACEVWLRCQQSGTTGFCTGHPCSQPTATRTQGCQAMHTGKENIHMAKEAEGSQTAQAGQERGEASAVVNRAVHSSSKKEQKGRKKRSKRRSRSREGGGGRAEGRGEKRGRGESVTIGGIQRNGKMEE